jgi:hypothetical protein
VTAPDRRPLPLPLPSSVSRGAVAVAVLCLATFAVSIPRVPVPWVDEINFVSAAASLARGGSGVPTLLPPGVPYTPFHHAYGPVFFWLTALTIKAIGLQPVAIRLWSVAGAIAAALAAGAVARAAGAARGWPAMVALLFVLSPEVGTIATSGRMDALADAFELGAMAAMIFALRASSMRAQIGAAVALGALAIGASMTTPRTLPYLVYLFALMLPLVATRRSRARSLVVIAAAAPVVLIVWTAWTSHIGMTPLGWLQWQQQASATDPFNRILPGTSQVFAIEVRNLITPLVAGVALAALVVVLARHARWRRVPPALVVAIGAAVLNTVTALVFTNRVFVFSSYFVLPMFVAVAAAWAVVASTDAVLRRGALVVGTAVGLLFAAGRVAKDVNIWQTWTYRDPAPLQAFVDRAIPRGSIVYAYEQYYFYAVEAAGAHYRDYTRRPDGLAPVFYGRGWETAPEAPDPPDARRLLLWPVDSPAGPVPVKYACAVGHEIARFSARNASATGVERLGAFDAALHGYPDARLFELPPGCPAAGPEVLQ